MNENNCNDQSRELNVAEKKSGNYVISEECNAEK